MIKVIQVIVLGILIFLIIRLVRLIINFSGGIKSKLDNRQKEKERIREQFNDIEEAEFRDITTDEEGNIKEKEND
jgi:hypothetical protein